MTDGFSHGTVFRACARVRAALDADLDAAVGVFGGTASDRRIWAAIAWRVGVEEFHFALMDKLAEDAVDNPARKPTAAFQAFLNERFPKAEAAEVPLPRKGASVDKAAGVPLPRKAASHRGSGALAASSAAKGGPA